MSKNRKLSILLTAALLLGTAFPLPAAAAEEPAEQMMEISETASDTADPAAGMETAAEMPGSEQTTEAQDPAAEATDPSGNEENPEAASGSADAQNPETPETTGTDTATEEAGTEQADTEKTDTEKADTEKSGTENASGEKSGADTADTGKKENEDPASDSEENPEEEEPQEEILVLSDGSSYVIDLGKVRIEEPKDPRESFEKITVTCAQVTQDAVPILAEMDKNAAVVGTIDKNGLVYILKKEKKGWLYVESGEVRGFLKKKYIKNTKETTEAVFAEGEDAYSLAQTAMDPQENPALCHTDTSVYLYHQPDGQEIADFVRKYEGENKKAETVVKRALRYFEIIKPGQSCGKKKYEKLATAVLSAQEAAAGDVCVYEDESVSVCLGENTCLKKDPETGTLRVMSAEEIEDPPAQVYRFTQEKEPEIVRYWYTTTNTFISPSNTPVAYAVAMRLRDAGFSPEAASGIVANLFAECGACGGADLNPAAYSESGVIAAGGIAGWTDNADSRGFTALQGYAAMYGMPWTDVYVQTDFLIENISQKWVYAPEYGSSQELSGRLFPMMYSLAEFMSSTDAKEAAISFLGVYEDDLYNGTAKWAGYTLDGWVQREVSVRTNLAGAVYNAFFLDEISG